MAKQTFDIAQRRTVLTKDCRVKLDTYQKRFARLAVVTLVLISGLFSVSFGQVKKAVDASKLEIFRKVGQETVLNGTVTDPNGAVVPSAEISLFKDSINVAKTKSDDYGYYVFSTLSPGIYSAEATGYGFKSYRVKNIKIGNNESLEMSISLKTDEKATCVLFLSDVDATVDMSSTSIRTNIRREMIEKLPH